MKLLGLHTVKKVGELLGHTVSEEWLKNKAELLKEQSHKIGKSRVPEVYSS